MSKIKNHLVAFGFFLALFTFAPVANYGQTAKPPADVNIVNTPNVNVVGTPAVHVGNTTANPLPVLIVDNPVRQPFTETLVTPNKPSFTVPAGKRLVIEFVSGGGFITSGQKFLNTSLQCTVATSVGVADVLHAFTPTMMGTQNTGTALFDIFSISQQTRLYVEPGGTVSIFMNNTAGVAGLGFTVTGHLVDVQ